MEINTENQNEMAADVASVIPIKEKNSFIIPWEKQEDLYISPDYFVKLYKGDKPLEDLHLYSYRVKLIKVNKFTWPFFLRNGNQKGKDVKIDLEILETGLKVKCDCKKRHNHLCDYVIIGLYRKFLVSNDFLKDLYAKDVAALPESQHKFFQLAISTLYYGNDRFCIENHNQFGQVYTYFDHQELESELLDVASENRWLGNLESRFSDLIYVVPRERQVEGLPFLIPFDTEKRINCLEEFGNEMPNIADRDVLKITLCRKILAFSKSAQKHSKDEGEDVVKDERNSVGKEYIINAWRKILRGGSDPELRVAFVERSNLRTEIENLKYPSRYRTIYKNVILADNDLSLKFHLKEDNDYLLLSLIVVYKGEELKDYGSECRSNFFFVNLNENECLFVDNLQKEFLLRSFSQISNKITVLKKDYEDFFTHFLIPLSTLFHIDLEPLDEGTVFVSDTTHRFHEFKVAVEKDRDGYLNFELKGVLNENEEYVIPCGGNLILKSENGSCMYTERDLVGESEFNDFTEKHLPSCEISTNRMTKRSRVHEYFHRNRLYEFIKKCRSKGYKIALNNISKRDEPVSTSTKMASIGYLHIEALQKLRQLCNSPVLMKDGDFGQDSIKLDFIDEIMDEVAPNHKILLFSAYTSMLKLAGQRIENKGIAYTYLDGKMNQDQRQNAVERFQNEDECRVFLISLKAGGTGLNLTAADYVYILDPWWNPAAEAQAIDRCYRIGQDKHVMAYKIVCRDSVEEYILALQESKKRISEGLILDETNLMKSISKEELLKLFE